MRTLGDGRPGVEGLGLFNGSRFARGLLEVGEVDSSKCELCQGRSLTPRSSSATTVAIRSARSAGLRFVASIQRR